MLRAGIDTLIMLGWSLGFTVLLGLPLGLSSTSPASRTAARPAAVSPAVVLRQRPAFAAVHYFADRHDPGHHLNYRHLPGRTGHHSTAGGGLRAFLCPAGGSALREVDHGLVEASWSMGGNTAQLIWHTLLPESRAGLVTAVTVTAILLVDYTSMAGVIGGGGLGDLAIVLATSAFRPT